MASPVTRVVLAEVAFARAGDKGDTSDVSLFARTAAVYAHLVEQVTVDRVRDLYGDLVRGDIRRYEVPNVWALKFVLERALGGGGPSSLRADNLGKAMGGALLRLSVQIPDEVLRDAGPRPTPPDDPYAGAPWVVR